MFTLPTIALLALVSAKTVALPSVTGPRRTPVREVERGVSEAFVEQNLEIIGEAELARAEKKLGKNADEIDAAKAAGAEFLAEVEITKSGKRMYISGEIIDTDSGDLVASVRRQLKSKGQARAAGRTLGLMLAQALEKADGGAPVEVDAGDELPAGEAPVKVAKKTRARPASAEPADPEPEEAEPAAAPRRVVPRDEDPALGGAAVAARAEGTSKYLSAEDRTVRLALGLGSHLSTSYAVSTGGEVTGLGYQLSPQTSLEIEGRLAPFDAPVSFEAAIDYAILKYRLDLEPATSPADPTGNHLTLRLSVAYEYSLSRWKGGELSIAPLGGIEYESLGVDDQEPYDVVLGFSAFSPRAGARLGLRLGDSVTLEAESALRFIASYSETLAKTGEGGSGLGITLGARFRWWLGDQFGAFVHAEYDYGAVSLSGDASRTTFVGDPAVSDAGIYDSHLAAAVGAVLAL